MSDARVPPLDVTWFGDRAVMVRLDLLDRRWPVVRMLSVAFPGAEVRAGLSSVLVERTAPDPGLLDAVSSVVSSIDDRGAPPWTGGRQVRITVAYGGADLAVAAGSLGLSGPDLVAAHIGQEWEVAMMGFAPGFGYLTPLGEPLIDWGTLPRRDHPRERVPAGSVAIAAGMSAVYPSQMPGGWHLIGRTDVVLFDPHDETSPTLLRPGDVVRFVDALR